MNSNQPSSDPLGNLLNNTLNCQDVLREAATVFESRQSFENEQFMNFYNAFQTNRENVIELYIKYNGNQPITAPLNSKIAHLLLFMEQQQKFNDNTREYYGNNDCPRALTNGKKMQSTLKELQEIANDNDEHFVDLFRDIGPYVTTNTVPIVDYSLMRVMIGDMFDMHPDDVVLLKIYPNRSCYFLQNVVINAFKSMCVPIMYDRDASVWLNKDSLDYQIQEILDWLNEPHREGTTAQIIPYILHLLNIDPLMPPNDLTFQLKLVYIIVNELEANKNMDYQQKIKLIEEIIRRIYAEPTTLIVQVSKNVELHFAPENRPIMNINIQNNGSNYLPPNSWGLDIAPVLSLNFYKNMYTKCRSPINITLLDNYIKCMRHIISNNLTKLEITENNTNIPVHCVRQFIKFVNVFYMVDNYHIHIKPNREIEMKKRKVYPSPTTADDDETIQKIDDIIKQIKESDSNLITFNRIYKICQLANLKITNLEVIYTILNRFKSILEYLVCAILINQLTDNVEIFNTFQMFDYYIQFVSYRRNNRNWQHDYRLVVKQLIGSTEQQNIMRNLHILNTDAVDQWLRDIELLVDSPFDIIINVNRTIHTVHVLSLLTFMCVKKPEEITPIGFAILCFALMSLVQYDDEKQLLARLFTQHASQTLTRTTKTKSTSLVKTTDKHTNTYTQSTHSDVAQYKFIDNVVDLYFAMYMDNINITHDIIFLIEHLNTNNLLNMSVFDKRFNKNIDSLITLLEMSCK